jgi:hypothetical protein
MTRRSGIGKKLGGDAVDQKKLCQNLRSPRRPRFPRIERHRRLAFRLFSTQPRTLYALSSGSPPRRLPFHSSVRQFVLVVCRAHGTLGPSVSLLLCVLPDDARMGSVDRAESVRPRLGARATIAGHLTDPAVSWFA